MYVFHRPEMMTLQLQFQLREKVEIAELDLGCSVDVEVRECFSSPEILESKAQCEPARYRGAAPSRLQCPFGLAGPVFEVIPRHLCRRHD